MRRAGGDRLSPREMEDLGQGGGDGARVCELASREGGGLCHGGCETYAVAGKVGESAVKGEFYPTRGPPLKQEGRGFAVGSCGGCETYAFVGKGRVKAVKQD